MNEKRDNWSKIDVIGKILGGILLPFVIFFVGTNINIQQQRKEQNQKNIDRVSSIIKSLSSENKREKELTLVFAKFLAQKKQFPEELFPVFLNVINSETDFDLAQEATNVLTVVGQTNEVVSNEVKNLKSDKTPLIYIQYKNDSSYTKAVQIHKILLSEGYRSPGIEHLEKAILKGNDLRYFSNSSEEVAFSNQLIKLIKPIIGEPKIYDMSERYKGEIKPFTYEIWIE
jgi:hypothetical protein